VQSLGVLPGSPPKVLRKSNAAKTAPKKTVLSSITNEGVSGPAPTLSSTLPSRQSGSISAATHSSSVPSRNRPDNVPAPIASLERSEIAHAVMDNNSRERSSQQTPVTRRPTNERGSGHALTNFGSIFSRERQVMVQEEMDIDSREQSSQKTPIPRTSIIEAGSGRASTHSGIIPPREHSEITQDDMEIDSRGRTKQRAAIPHRAYKSSSTSSSRSRSETRKHMKSAPFVDGVVPSGRPAIKDYIPVVRRRLLDGAYIYENWVLSNNSFPDKELQYAWAREVWDRASVDALDFYKLSDRMMKLVSSPLF
jgi:hypothetical protein